MNLKSQVIAINKLLSDIYQIQDMRLSYLLAELAFTDADIRLIRQKLLPNVTGIFLNVLENNEIVIFESNFSEFYDNFLHNVKLLNWHDPLGSKIKAVRQKYSRAYEIWTSEEEQWLKSYLAEDLSISEIAELLERQPGAISSRINKLGLR